VLSKEQEEMALLEIKNIAVSINTEMLFLVDEGTILSDSYSQDRADDYLNSLSEFAGTLTLAIKAMEYPVNQLFRDEK
jgi:DNA recombination-dependent growth factor C